MAGNVSSGRAATRDFISFTNIYRAYIFPVIVFSGIAGNCISLVVFPRLKRHDKSTAHYLSFLAASDLLNILSNGLIDSWLYNALRDIGAANVNVLGSSSVVCKLLRYIWYVTTFTSTWNLTLFNVEKCIAIRYPMKRSRIVTSKRRKRALFVVLAVGCLIRAPFLHSYDIVLNKNGELECSLLFKRLTSYGTLLMILFEWLTSFIIPWLAITVSSIFIMAAIFKWRKERLIAYTGGSGTKQSYKFVLNLTSVSAIFLITVSPAIALWGMFWLQHFFKVTFGIESKYDVLKLALISTNVQDLNFCLNFFIYVICLDFYRAEVRYILLRCC
ncbi:somatostatin receptor type 1-like [Tubulanus polymorphus]|uniref:somatostatin receptor type 1-like n=1 Tax=Tubulanus polymorphus TaxID=672921 RepID=UPI003DA24BB7